MNVGPLFTVAILLALVVRFALSSGSLRCRDRSIGYCTFTECGFHRVRADGRTPYSQDWTPRRLFALHQFKLLEGWANGAEARTA